MTYDPDQRRATPLASRLAARIAREGPLSIAEYMQACLQDPGHGYYRSQAAIGRDFITAPEISQIFGELIGLWCAVVWHQMGQPTPVSLIELGPGRGTMMRDMLRALRAVPAFLSAAEVHLVESSERLVALQRDALREAPVDISWHKDLGEAPQQPQIIVGNEFLDTLPARQLVRTGEGWAERTVVVDRDRGLAFAVEAVADKETAALLRARYASAKPSEIVQLHDFAALAQQLGTRAAAHPLAALLIDYGHTTSSPGDTLQAVRANGYEHPLTSPGEADLTLQVDFAQLADALAQQPGIAIDGPVAQSELLGALGIVERASRLMSANPARANEIETAAQRLMAPHAMGTRFKAIGVRSAALPTLPGLVSMHATLPA
ncbi:MAG: class I SAM-dependent methyltransferase [Bacteroidota bacterium]|jgi:SAM-dependent MidA family methyltransferase